MEVIDYTDPTQPVRKCKSSSIRISFCVRTVGHIFHHVQIIDIILDQFDSSKYNFPTWFNCINSSADNLRK